MSQKAVFLHIGTPKSGTTYLQAICNENRERLADAGVLWPGRAWSDQVLAVRDLIQAHPHDHVGPEVSGAWERLVAEVNDWHGRAALISMEWLVSAAPQYIHRAIETLHPAEVRVIVTARDIARTIPSQWQESVQNWGTWSWEEYVSGAVDAHRLATEAGRDVWEQHDLNAIMSAWAEAVPAQRTYLVTVPPAGSDPQVLWQRFADVLGLHPEGFDMPGPQNPSLGASSAEFMRRINIATRQHEMEWPVYEQMLKYGLAKDVLYHRRSSERRVTLPAATLAWAVERGQELAAGVAASGAHVVGDLADLVPSGHEVEATDLPDLDAEDVLEAATDGIARMSALVHRELSLARRERDAAVESLRAYRDVSSSRRAKRFLVEISDQAPLVKALYRAYKRLQRLTSASRTPGLTDADLRDASQ